jgi:hypothetical protein
MKISKRLGILIQSMRIYHDAIMDRTTSANFTDYAVKQLERFHSRYPHLFSYCILMRRDLK